MADPHTPSLLSATPASFNEPLAEALSVEGGSTLDSLAKTASVETSLATDSAAEGSLATDPAAEPHSTHESLMESSTESSTVSPPSQPTLSEALVRQMVLRLTEAPVDLFPALSQSPQVLTAMQRLVELLQTLRSPDSGWSPEVPQTPETLLPYVAEEAYEVLEALETCLDHTSQPTQSPALDAGIRTELWQRYGSMDDLAAHLLWGIARSAYEVMRLLEGITAQVIVGGRSHTGILRLAVVMQVTVGDRQQTRDLVTYHVSPSLLPTESQIELLQDNLIPNPTSAAHLLEGLTRQIELATPAIAPFLEGLAIEALLPQEHWQSGTLQLRLQIEFVEDQSRMLPSPNLADQEPSASEFFLQFTDGVWLNTYRTVVIQQQLAHLIPRLSGYQAVVDASIPPLSDEVVPLLVKNAFEIAQTLEQTPTFFHRNFPHHTLPSQHIAFKHLLPWLMWCVSRSAYDVMHLMGGIRCRLLQPEHDWVEGTLRLLVTLKVKTPEMDWYFDLATGQLPQPTIFPLDPNGVVQSHECDWSRSPLLIQHLETRIMGQLEQATPELRLLIEGTEVDLKPAGAEWQPGVVQLLVDMDFIPDFKLSTHGA